MWIYPTRKEEWRTDGTGTSLVITEGRLTWFGHVESKDDTDWIKCCKVMEVEGTKPSGCLRKTG